jgi:4-amino-4-deoxy-L-arabinose transferase-like glycosyltransferase
MAGVYVVTTAERMTISFERRLALAAVAAWLAVAIVALAFGPPLGHDEAAFSVAARGDGPPWLYRSTGVIAVAHVGVLLGGADWAMRLASAVLGLGVVIGAFAVGRAAFDERAGAWAAAVIAGAHPMVLRSAEVIGDLPATACMLVGIAVMIEELRRDGGPRWRIVGAAPAFAAAFYFRYGSAPVIALAGGAAAVLWWRSLARRPLPVLAAAALFVAMLAPHALHSLEATGSLFGVLEVSARMPRREYVGEGLVTYVTSNPFRFYGGLVAPVMIAGLAGVVRRPSRPAIFLAVVALGQIVAIGLQSHAQPRYVYVATALLVVLGVDAIARFANDRNFGGRRFALALVTLAWLAIAVAMVPYTRWLARERGSIVAASEVVRRAAEGNPCVVAARVVTQLMWYTGCEGYLYKPYAALPPAPGKEHFIVSVPHAVIEFPSVPLPDGTKTIWSFNTDEPDVPRAQVWQIDR